MPATLQIPLGLTGVTPLTCDLFPENSDTAAASGVTLTEATNRKGFYTASVSVTGWHTVKLYVSAAYFPAVFAAQIPSSGTITAVSEAGVVRADNRDGAAIPASATALTPQDITDIATETSLQVAAVVQGLTGGISQDTIANGGTLRLKRGDSYVAADGRQKTFTVSGINGDWSGGTAKLWLQGRAANIEDIPETSFSQVDDVITATFDVAAADFDAIPVGQAWRWELKVTLGGTRLNTPIEGKLVVDPSIPTA